MHHVQIPFKFEMGICKTLRIISGNDPDKKCSKSLQENVHVALRKYWTEIKIKPIFLVAHGHLFWAFGINAIIICIGHIYDIFIYICPTILIFM